MKHRNLHTLHRPAKQRNGHPPLVFVHGGYVHGACWDENFLPHFSTLGCDCHAIDLSGHGRSAGRDQLDSYDLDHYAADVAQVVAGLPALPVLSGHSMGALVVQRYLEKGQAAAVIMMAPVQKSAPTPRQPWRKSIHHETKLVTPVSAEKNCIAGSQHDFAHG